MKAERAGGKGSQSDRVGSAPVEAPELPTDKAFVLQLSRDTGPTLEPFTGRVEHLATGRRLRFETFAAFQEAVIRLLTDSKPRPDKGDPKT